MKVKTPVLIYADLPAELQVPDDQIGGTHRICTPRCQARARGDSHKAILKGIPAKGGYRCRGIVEGWGLCWRHLPKASEAVQVRALELHMTEAAQKSRGTVAVGVNP